MTRSVCGARCGVEWRAEAWRGAARPPAWRRWWRADGKKRRRPCRCYFRLYIGLFLFTLLRTVQLRKSYEIPPESYLKTGLCRSHLSHDKVFYDTITSAAGGM